MEALSDARRKLSTRATWCLGLLSIGLAVGLALGFAFYGRQVDLGVYLLGGSHVASSNLYSLTFERQLFTYPPFAAVLFAPLAELRPTAAQVIWDLLNVVALLWLIDVSLRTVRPQATTNEVRRWAALLVGPAMLLNPVLQTAYLGQINILLVALVITDLAYGWPYLPKGLLTGVAAAIKLTPLIFIPWLFLTRQYKAACWATGTFLACVGLGYVVAPTSSRLYWTKYVFDSKRAGGLLSIANQNLKSALMRIAHGQVSSELVVPLTFGIAVVGIAIAVWAYRTSSPMLGVLVCATTGLVISPVTWSHHLVWVVPAILWMALAPDGPRHALRWALLVAAFFWAGPIWWVPRADRGLHESVWEIVVGDSFLWAMLSYLLLTACQLARRRLHSGVVRPLGRRADLEMTG